MTRKHQYFVNEVLKHGDKVKAYKKVYPTAKKSSLVSASGRLMSRPEIDAAVNGRLGEISAEIEAEVRAELKPRIIDDVMLKERLSLIVMGEVQMRREVKSNGDTIFLRSDPGFGQVLRAGHMLCLMEGWYKMSAGKEKESGGEKQKESETVAEREPTQEERDEQRRKGMFINWQYWRIEEFYAENGQFYTSADQLRDKEFFLQRAFEQYGTKERPLVVEGWGGPRKTQVSGSGSWQEKLKVNDEAAFETSGDFSLAARGRNDDLDFSKSTSLKQTQFVNTFEKTSSGEQNATKTSTSQSGTSSSDNNKNTNKIAKPEPKPEPPKQYNGRDQLKSNGYMNLQEMLKRYEWEAKNNRSIRAKVDSFPLGEDERIYMKYEILSHALTLPPEMCKKVFDSMGYELYAYNNNWFRTKR